QSPQLCVKGMGRGKVLLNKESELRETPERVRDMSHVISCSGNGQALFLPQASADIVALGEIYSRQHEKDINDHLAVFRCHEDFPGFLNEFACFGIGALDQSDLPKHPKGIPNIVDIVEFPEQRQTLEAQALSLLKICFDIRQSS